MYAFWKKLYFLYGKTFTLEEYDYFLLKNPDDYNNKMHYNELSYKGYIDYNGYNEWKFTDKFIDDIVSNMSM